VPWCTLFLVCGLRGTTPEAEEQLLLDRDPFWVLFHYTLPQIELAFGACFLWILATTFGEIAATDYFQVRTFSEELYLGFATEPETLLIVQRMSPSMITLLLAVALLWISWNSRVGRVEERAGPVRGGTWSIPLSRPAQSAALVAMAAVALCVIAVPVIQLIYQSGLEVRPRAGGREYSWSFVRLAVRLVQAVQQTRHELALSLLLSQLVAAACVGLAGPISWCSKGRRGWSGLWILLLAGAVAVPAPVLAIGVIHVLNQPGQTVLNWLYDRTLFPLWLVHVVRCLPWAALVLGLAVKSVPDSVREAARLDGRVGIWQYLTLGLPMTFSHHLAAWLLVSALSLGELTASILVTPPGYTTLAVEFFSQLHYGTRYEVAALCLLVWIATIALGVLGTLNGWYGWQRSGHSGE
jgi:iron(III) transport system permease protein